MWGFVVRSKAVLIPLLLGAGPSGFRGDGSGVWANASPPTTIAPTAPLWSAKLPAWSNGSPVAFGELVCVTVEPVDLRCHRAGDGSLAWRSSLPVIDALPSDLAATLRPGIEAAKAGEAQLPGLLAEQSRLRRLVRGGDTTVVAALEAVSAQILSTQAALKPYAAYFTPPVLEQIGWSTPTPLADGSTLYALFGNGAVAAYDAAGKRRWSRWLGPAPEGGMRGYTRGTTASPLLVDGVLVVGHRTLWGLDPATGAVRWQGPAYTDYGTPTVATVAGQHVLLTGDGRAIRPRDGKVLATGLGDIYFVSPVASGAVAWFIGSHTGGHAKAQGAWAERLELTLAGDTLTVSKAWHVDLPSPERVFSQPVLLGDALHVVQENGTWVVLDGGTGAVRHTANFGQEACGKGYFTATVAAGDAVWFGCEAGRLLRAAGTDAAVFNVGPLRSTPTFHGSRLYLRTFEALVAFGG